MRRCQDWPACSIEGCEKVYVCRGLCEKHYARLKRHGDPLQVRPTQATCSIEGCFRSHNSHGLCQTHDARRRKWGDPLHVAIRVHAGTASARVAVPKTTAQATPAIRQCSLPGCGGRHYGRGYCRKHYARVVKLNRQ